MNSNNKSDRVAVAAPGSFAEFPPSEVEQRVEQLPRAAKGGVLGDAVAHSSVTSKPEAVQPGIRMVRYRLAVGCKHQLVAEELKKILIEESGVDKKNINIINIQGDYTLVELPDEMPQDIFLHLKTVEIKQHKLDIKRVKARNKKRSNNRNRRRQRIPQSALVEPSDKDKD